MATYRGPHVAVYQKFERSAAGTAVENLAPAIVGTAYEVYENEVVGKGYGIEDNTINWPTTSKIMYDETVVGEKEYDMYPVKITAGDDNKEVESATYNDSSIIVPKDATIPVDEAFKIEGSNSAYIPFYKVTTPVTTNGTSIIEVTNGSMKSSKIVADQHVYLYSGQLAFYAGTIVGDVISETKVRVTKLLPKMNYDGIVIGSAYSESVVFTEKGVSPLSLDSAGKVTGLSPIQGVGIIKANDLVYVGNKVSELFTWTYVGKAVADNVFGATAIQTDTADTSAIAGSYDYVMAGSEIETIPNTIHDPSGNFTKVVRGNIVKFNGASIGDNEASIVTRGTSEKTLFFYTGTVDTSDIVTYKSAQITARSTVMLKSYSVGKLVGFSRGYGKTGSYTATDTAPVSPIFNVLFKLDPTLTNGYVPNIGDFVGESNTSTSNVITEVLPTAITGEYNLTFMNSVPAAVDVDIYSWVPDNGNLDVKATFRAINPVENLNYVRIEKIKDIEDAWGTISAYNELAYMMLTAYQFSGNKVCYGINVDATEEVEYYEALDVLKGLDVYSHAFGTTDGGFNANIGSYVNAESDPYLGHERIAVTSLDEDDIFYITQGSVTTFDGVTINTSANLLEPGNEVSRGDIVTIFNSTKTGIYSAATSPVTSHIVDVKYVSGDDMSSEANLTAKFMIGVPSKQAEKLSNISIGERRVSLVYPGWFEAEYDGETKMFPPYFITSSIAGLDSGEIVSQSFTSLTYALPGMSKVKLKTDSIYNKLLLDDIGSAGIDIMIQGSPITTIIKSRHDLTTDMSSIEFRERSITKQVDVVAKTMRAAVTPYVGKYNIEDSLLDFIRKILTITADAIVKSSITKAVTVVSVERDKDIKDKINIIVDVTVFVAGNYYDITLNVKS